MPRTLMDTLNSAPPTPTPGASSGPFPPPASTEQPHLMRPPPVQVNFGDSTHTACFELEQIPRGLLVLENLLSDPSRIISPKILLLS